MNILITILVVLGSIIALLLIIALLTKKEFRVSRQIVINRPRADVFNYIRMLKNQEYYSVWVMKDPNINLVYTGTDGTIGATSSWTSDDKNVGIGEQEIIKMVENENIEVEIRFKKPFEATSYGHTKLTSPGEGQTEVTNLFLGKSKFPMNLMNLMMDKLLGKDMQTNLDNLKKILEG